MSHMLTLLATQNSFYVKKGGCERRNHIRWFQWRYPRHGLLMKRRIRPKHFTHKLLTSIKNLRLKLIITQYYHNFVKSYCAICGLNNWSFFEVSKAAVIPRYCAIAWSHLGYAMEANSPNLRADIDHMESNTYWMLNLILQLTIHKRYTKSRNPTQPTAHFCQIWHFISLSLKSVNHT